MSVGVLKELRASSVHPERIQSKAGRGPERLRTLVTNLQRLRGRANECRHCVPSATARLGISERNSKHRSAIPAATCEFDLPDYYYWLAQSDEPRSALSINARDAAPAMPMQRGASLANAPERQDARGKAAAGLFHITFERDTPYQLLRISLPINAGNVPEISGSHYRCSVRFLKWNGLTAVPRKG